MGRLPAELTSFVDRRSEVAEVKRLLSATRLLTLTGVGGTGKTRLAVRVATDMRRAFPAGVWMVDLAPVRDASTLELVVAETLDLVDQTNRPVAEVLAGYLGARELLLVLDGCEHLLDACARFAGWALRVAPGLRVLCTSRQPLGLVGEQVWPVPPLTVPDPAVRSHDGANGQSSAVALFVARAAATMVGFTLSDDNRNEVVEVCRRLDGLPLAIELAAAQLHTRSISGLVSTLVDRFQVLTVRHAVPSRHRTLQAAFDWSFGLCSPPEQMLWSRLAVFHDSFDLAAAEAVCADARLPVGAVQDAVFGLVDKSVLILDDVAGHARYRLLETVRQYGLQRLPADDESREATLRRRHRDWYLRVTRRFDADWFGPGQLDWLARMRRDRGNLHAALRFSLATPAEAAAGLELAVGLRYYWFASGLLHEGRYWLNQALAANPQPTPGRAAALAAYCEMTLPTGDVDRAYARADELRELADRTGEPRLLALAHRAVGMNAVVGGDLPTANVELERALALFTQIGEQSMTVALGHLSLAMTALFMGDLDRAAALCADNRAVCEARGDRWWLAHTFSSSSHVAVYAGDIPRAAEYTRQALEVAATMGDTVMIAVAVERFAWIAGAGDDHERAARLLGAADQMWQQLGRVMYGAAQWLRGHDTCVADARAALGEAAYRAAFRRGAALAPDQATAEALRRNHPATGRTAAPRADPGSVLTPREREVAALVARGLSNRQIATRLGTSQRTAESHVENILRKLGFTSRTQVATWVAEQQRP